MPYCSFISGLTKRQPMVVSSIFWPRPKALSALPITYGARDIDSTPPAMASSISPQAMARNAVPMASIPEAQRRLRVTPGTLSGKPASSSAMRATLRLSSPAWLAQPRNTSSNADQSTPGLRSTRAFSGTAARSSARTAERLPPKRPIGVRTASQMNTSRLIRRSPSVHGRPRCAPRGRAARRVRPRSARASRRPARRSGSPSRWPRPPARGSRPDAAK
ncbi:Uncharacterised protein [Pseudomonas aeruginosa]|nr:Uncharacterised protein [Pseudomonas aeruginosa]